MVRIGIAEIRGHHRRNSGPKLLDLPQDDVLAAVRQNDHEFVAAKADHGILTAHMGLQHIRYLGEHFVPCQMTQGVIDSLELPQVQQNEADAGRQPVSSPVEEGELIEVSAVEGPGQIVPVQLFLDLLQPLQHVLAVLLGLQQQLIGHVADDLHHHLQLLPARKERQRLGDHVKHIFPDELILGPLAAAGRGLHAGAVEAAALPVPHVEAGVGFPAERAVLLQRHHRRVRGVHQADHIEKRRQAAKGLPHRVHCIAAFGSHVQYLPPFPEISGICMCCFIIRPFPKKASKFQRFPFFGQVLSRLMGSRSKRRRSALPLKGMRG